MARSDTLRSQIARLEEKGAALHRELAAAQKVANDANATARRKQEQAARTSSASSQRMALSAAEREAKKGTEAQKKIGAISGKIADNTKALARDQAALRTALANEHRAADRDAEKRRRTEIQHARELARAAAPLPPLRYVAVQPPKPEPLRVLYLTANPEAVETTTVYPDGTVETNGVWLRVEYEVRRVKDMLLRSKFRDMVTVSAHVIPQVERVGAHVIPQGRAHVIPQVG